MKKRVADSGGNAGETLTAEKRETLEKLIGPFLSELVRQVLDGELFDPQLDLILEHRPEAFEIPSWVLKRAKEVRSLLNSFFGNEFRAWMFNEELFRKTLLSFGREQVLAWEAIGLKPFYLPGLVMERGADYPGWKPEQRPNDFYWKSLAGGKLLRYNEEGELVPDRQANKLPGAVLLVDTLCKPFYTDGSQMWKDDYLGATIKALRKKGRLHKYQHGPQDSRFGISGDAEWEEAFKPAVHQLLNLKSPSYVRLETTMELNVLSQALQGSPRARDGQTNTSVWLEEFFGDSSKRLCGGYSDYGGLANVGWDYSWNHWNDRSVRPLAVLAVG